MRLVWGIAKGGERKTMLIIYNQRGVFFEWKKRGLTNGKKEGGKGSKKGAKRTNEKRGKDWRKKQGQNNAERKRTNKTAERKKGGVSCVRQSYLFSVDNMPWIGGDIYTPNSKKRTAHSSCPFHLPLNFFYPTTSPKSIDHHLECKSINRMYFVYAYIGGDFRTSSKGSKPALK